jgi:hypothetical protein
MGESRPRFRSFPSTHWSEVVAAAAESTSASQPGLSRVLHQYLPVLRSYLIWVRRLRPDVADDLLQGFVVDKILEGHLLTKADQTRGRFRSFLLSALNNYLSNDHRYQAALSRGGGVAMLSVDLHLDISAQASDTISALDATWARALVHQVIADMKAECLRASRLDIWRVFQGRVVEPAFEGKEPAVYETLVRECGFTTPAQACNALVTGKRMFSRLFRAMVSQYVGGDGEIDREISELRAILSQVDA